MYNFTIIKDIGQFIKTIFYDSADINIINDIRTINNNYTNNIKNSTTEIEKNIMTLEKYIELEFLFSTKVDLFYEYTLSSWHGFKDEQSFFMPSEFNYLLFNQYKNKSLEYIGKILKKTIELHLNNDYSEDKLINHISRIKIKDKKIHAIDHKIKKNNLINKIEKDILGFNTITTILNSKENKYKKYNTLIDYTEFDKIKLLKKFFIGKISSGEIECSFFKLAYDISDYYLFKTKDIIPKIWIWRYNQSSCF